MADKKQIKIQKDIARILFSDAKDKVVAEKLTIIIIKDKVKWFRFLKGYTQWKSVGYWKGIKDDNVVINVIFWDSKDNKYGKRLMRLLRTYNKLYIKEIVLYAETVRMSESPRKKDIMENTLD